MRLQQAGVTMTTWVTSASELRGARNWETGAGAKNMQRIGTFHGGTSLTVIHDQRQLGCIVNVASSHYQELHHES